MRPVATVLPIPVSMPDTRYVFSIAVLLKYSIFSSTYYIIIPQKFGNFRANSLLPWRRGFGTISVMQIFDTVLRDGEQALEYAMNKDEKVRMALQLETLGVDVMEAGFAAASPGDFASVKAVADAIASGELVLEMPASEDDYTFPIF